MRYHVISNEDAERVRWERQLRERGFEVVEEYDPGAVLVTLGGDGTILYAARNYPEPTILPVRTGDSKGLRTYLETEELADAVARIDSGAIGETHAVVEHPKLAVYRDGEELRGGFRALNDVSLHHSAPMLAAVFDVRIDDAGEVRSFERLSGDGLVVATPFGSTAYYRSITGGTFSRGIGVAFNNVHTPLEAPEYVVVSEDAAVEIELLADDHSSGAVLVRDNAEDTYELSAGEPVEVRRSQEIVELIRPFPPD